MDSHGFFLRSQGASEQTAEALARADLEAADLPEDERALLAFTEKVTLEAHRIVPSDIQTLRQAGWTDEQIAEAVYVAALFAFFNRVADAFGLASQGYGGPRPEWT